MLDKLGGVFAPKPSAGPHKTRECLPLCLILRNRLKYALTYKEVTTILMQRLVKVDGKTRVDKCYPAGFMGEYREPPFHRIVRGAIIRFPVLGVLRIVTSIALRLGCVPNWGDGDWRPSVPIVEVDLLLQRRKVPTTQATDAQGVQPRAEKKPFRCDVDARWVPRGIVEGCFQGR